MDKKLNDELQIESTETSENQTVEVSKDILDKLKESENKETKKRQPRGKKKYDIEAKEITLQLVMLMKANNIQLQEYEIKYMEDTIRCLVEKYNFDFKYKCELSFLMIMSNIVYRNYNQNKTFRERIKKVIFFTKNIFKKFKWF